MIRKNTAEEIAPYLKDASNFPGGRAEGVFFPENEKETAEFVREAFEHGTPVTVAGGGTGLAGGRVPMGGWVLATDQLNSIQRVEAFPTGGGAASAGSGVRLRDFLTAVGRANLYYPPDPTSWPSFLGGNVATNASGPRTFKHGATRAFIRRLRVVTGTGEAIEITRGQCVAPAGGTLEIPAPSGTLRVPVPSYHLPPVKNTAGYFAADRTDAIDLFIGSEGTLGIVTEIETALLTLPRVILSFVVFFPQEELAWHFAAEARALSLRHRAQRNDAALQASALEYMDAASLAMIRDRYPSIPHDAFAALCIEQECQPETADLLMEAWSALMEKHGASFEPEEWFADEPAGQDKLKEFRHAVPMAVKDFLQRHGQAKVGTDTAVPHEHFEMLMLFHRKRLEELNLPHLTFGHIGDSHVHLNILTRTEEEHARAWALYHEFVTRAIELGGTVAAEHGIGKMKRPYLEQMLGPAAVNQMRAVKKAFDPRGILGRGNIFPE